MAILSSLGSLFGVASAADFCPSCFLGKWFCDLANAVMFSTEGFMLLLRLPWQFKSASKIPSQAKIVLIAQKGKRTQNGQGGTMSSNYLFSGVCK